MNESTGANDRFERPAVGWYVLLQGGLTTVGILSVSGAAYRSLAQRVPLPPRRLLQAVWVGSGVVHVAEAAYAYRLARAEGMDRTAGRWARETLIVGFPSLRKLNQVRAR